MRRPDLLTALACLGCSGLLQPVVVPVPHVVVVSPEEEAETTSRLEIFWGPPEQGDAVWVEGERMTWHPELGPEGTWALDVQPGAYEIAIRDGLTGGKHRVESDLVVGPQQVLWCHPLEWDPDLPFVIVEDDCRRSVWPGDIDRNPL